MLSFKNRIVIIIHNLHSQLFAISIVHSLCICRCLNFWIYCRISTSFFFFFHIFLEQFFAQSRKPHNSYNVLTNCTSFGCIDNNINSPLVTGNCVNYSILFTLVYLKTINYTPFIVDIAAFELLIHILIIYEPFENTKKATLLLL